jgi:hypothetical protein
MMLAELLPDTPTRTQQQVRGTLENIDTIITTTTTTSFNSPPKFGSNLPFGESGNKYDLK